ncbi:MAG: AAA family ATPase [Planctomycetes bacterium]|nr:AAA family ATPase [Planctomycetota bacterium]
MNKVGGAAGAGTLGCGDGTVQASTPGELFELLSSWVPASVRRRIAADPGRAPGPYEERGWGAVLFADILGFTSLAERLARRGPEGAEELSRMLEAFLGRLDELVVAHGGETVSFAGDATLAFWRSETPEGVAEAARRTAACGLAIQAALDWFEVGSETKLRFRIGVGAGRILLGAVGGVGGRWEFLVAGQPLAQMESAQRVAEPGDVVLSAAAAALLRDVAEARALPEGCARLVSVRGPALGAPPASATAAGPIAAAPPTARPAPSVEAIAALRAFIPATVLARIDAGHTQWLSEFRRLTVLFLSIAGIDYDAPDALDRVHRAVAMLQTFLVKYEGSLHQFMVDDKGSTFIAAWGLPLLAHEEDPIRAVQAAQEMLAALAALGLRGSAGVTTGHVFTGTQGGRSRRLYTILGDEVNLAARLVHAAAGNILCDSATRKAAEGFLAFESVPDLVLKGKAGPVPAHRPASAPPSAEPASERGRTDIIRRHESPRRHGARSGPDPLVGRESERRLLVERLRDLVEEGRSDLAGGPAAGPRGGLVLVEGEPGIGKSKLVEFLLAEARALGLPCLLGAGDQVESATAHFPWREIFASLLELGAAPNPEARRERVLAPFRNEPGLAAWTPLLATLLSVELPENDLSRHMSEQARADCLRELLVHLLRRQVGGAPAVLVLEDAHWMDSASWSLALAVRRRVRSLLLVVVFRPVPSPAPEEVRVLLESPEAVRLRLDVLSEEDAQTLACRRLGVAALAGPVRELILRRAEGHPFFVEELVYALRDAGLLELSDGTCRLAAGSEDLAALKFPDTIEGVITSRIDRLLQPEQLALKVASVIGRVVPLQLLSDVYPLDSDRPRLAEHLVRIEQQGLFLRDPAQSNPGYVFKHGITRDVVYALLVFGQRRQLHRAVAEWYERTFASDLSPHYPLLAHHWTQAREADRAVDYLEKAGEQALRGFSNRVAVTFFRLALEQADQSPPLAGPARRASWEGRLGDAWFGLGEFDRARTHYAKALSVWGYALPAGRVSQGLGLVGHVLRQGLHLVAPAGWLLVRADRREAAREAAHIHHRLSQAAFFEQDLFGLLHATFAGLNFAERSDSPHDRAHAYMTVSIAAGLSCLHGLARHYSLRSIEEAERSGEPGTLAWSWFVRGVYHYSAAKWEVADECFASALREFDRLGDRFRWEMTQGATGYAALFRGRLVVAERALEAVLAVCGPDGPPKYRVWGHACRGIVALARGPCAEELARNLEAVLACPLDHGDAILAQGTLAAVRLRRGELGAARECADAFSRLVARGMPATVYTAWGVVGGLEVFLELWAREQVSGAAAMWREHAWRACRALRIMGVQNAVVQPLALFALGRCRELDGARRGARRAWERSARLANRRGMPYEEARALAELGLRASGSERGPLLARAAALFESVGATHDLGRLRAAQKDGGGAGARPKPKDDD